jgi:hypothetical protein
VQLLRRAVIQAKEALSFAPSASMELEYGDRKYARLLDVELFNRLIDRLWHAGSVPTASRTPA